MSFKQKFNIQIDKINSLDSKFDIIEVLGHGAMGYIYKARDKRFNILLGSSDTPYQSHGGRQNAEYTSYHLSRNGADSNNNNQKHEGDVDGVEADDAMNAIVLKCREKSMVKLRDFQREVFYSYLLSAHENIVNTFNVAYETPTDYMMVQEVAPFGTLVNWVPRKKGLEEWPAAKDILRQIGFAIEFMHSKDVVHCDIRPENVLVFQHERYEAAVMPNLEGSTTALVGKDDKQQPSIINNNYINSTNIAGVKDHSPQILTTSAHFRPSTLAQNLSNTLNIPLLKRSPSFSSLFSSNKHSQNHLNLNSSSQALVPPLGNILLNLAGKSGHDPREITLSTGANVKIIGNFRVKLAGFDKSLKRGSLIKKLAKANSYSAPEICDVFYKEGYVVEPSADVWAYGILVYYILTGTLPWTSAIESSDPGFTDFVWWIKRKRLSVPTEFKQFTDKFCKYFRKVFELKRDKRCSIKDINKYMPERWKKIPEKLHLDNNNNNNMEGVLIDHVIAVHQRHHKNNEYGEEDDSTESDSIRQQIEEFENVLTHRGVHIEIDKSLRKKRIENWLKSNPSDASLPNMGESSFEEADNAPDNDDSHQLSSLSYSMRGIKNYPSRLGNSKSPKLRRQPKDNISEEEYASTTKPYKSPHSLTKMKKPSTLLKTDDELRKGSMSTHSQGVTPRVSVDESELGFYPKTSEISEKPEYLRDTTYSLAMMGRHLPTNIMTHNQKENANVSDTCSKQITPKLASNYVTQHHTDPPPHVSIFLEQASSDSISDGP